MQGWTTVSLSTFAKIPFCASCTKSYSFCIFFVANRGKKLRPRKNPEKCRRCLGHSSFQCKVVKNICLQEWRLFIPSRACRAGVHAAKERLHRTRSPRASKQAQHDLRYGGSSVSSSELLHSCTSQIIRSSSFSCDDSHRLSQRRSGTVRAEPASTTGIAGFAPDALNCGAVLLVCSMFYNAVADSRPQWMARGLGYLEVASLL